MEYQLLWQNISFDVVHKERTLWKTRTKIKKILDDVSGEAQSSSLMAIMGLSGSGKTSLLGAISGRIKDKHGIIKINNTPVSNDNLKSISGFVQQDDIFTENLTPLEHLEFTAGLQLSKKTKEKRNLVITKLMFELGLELQGNSLIKRLSGGERRRLSLASQLLNDPLLLFCDEPTSGLDSFSAITVIQKLQAISRSGKIVLTTIHQPSSQLFGYFEHITLLAEGRLAFQGTKDQAQGFFESLNLVCPSTYNPADFYIKCLNDQADAPGICDVFRMRGRSKEGSVGGNPNHLRAIVEDSRRSRSGFFTELGWLLWRCFKTMQREMHIHLISYIFLIAEALILSLSFAYLRLTDKNSVQNIQGIIFFMISEVVFVNMYSVINVFPAETAIFLKEKTLYSPCSYFISKITSLIPICFLSSLSYSVLFFVLLDFFTGVDFLIKMVYIMFLISMVSCGLGLAFSATFTKVEHVDLVMGSLEFLLMVMSGFWVKLGTVSVFLGWIKYMSPFFYGFETISGIFWKDVSFIGNCSAEEGIPCFSNGIEVLESYGINLGSLFNDFLYAHVLIAVFCFIGFIGILRKRHVYNMY